MTEADHTKTVMIDQWAAAHEADDTAGAARMLAQYQAKTGELLKIDPIPGPGFKTTKKPHDG